MGFDSGLTELEDPHADKATTHEGLEENREEIIHPLESQDSWIQKDVRHFGETREYIDPRELEGSPSDENEVRHFEETREYTHPSELESAPNDKENICGNPVNYVGGPISDGLVTTPQRPSSPAPWCSPSLEKSARQQRRARAKLNKAKCVYGTPGIPEMP